MAKTPPVIYVLHGEDELKIAQSIADLKARLGDPAMADLNTVRLDARSTSFDDLVTATTALPFLTPRRLVVLTHPLSRYSSQGEREKILHLLEQVPPSTALVLVEYRDLTDKAALKKGQLNWLEKWAREAGERVYLREFPLPRGSAMTGWVLERARELGGEFSPQAAALLGSLIGDELRLADQEIQKLLTYVNLERPVEVDDIHLVTSIAKQIRIFDLVDALGHQKGQQAQRLFRSLLADQDAMSIFYAVVNHFRNLLLAREIQENGGDGAQVLEKLKLHPYVIQKIVSQSQRFTLVMLERIYRRLLEIDLAEKSGEMDVELSLDAFIAELTA